MARRRGYAPLGVFLNGRRVGTFERRSTGAVAFAYDEAWLGWSHTLPVSLSLPLREEPYVGKAVFAVFDNLLPDDARARERLAQHSGAEGSDAFSLLAAVGRDCVGALQFLPDGEQPVRPSPEKSPAMSDGEIAALLRGLAVAPLGVRADDEFRISLAGAHAKTALFHRRGRWYRPLGTTPTTHILKPQIGALPGGLDLSRSVENEHLCMTFCREVGLPAARTEIADFEGYRVLVVERFDRMWTKDQRLLRVPQEDCCQALGVSPALKYQSDGGPGMRDILGLLHGSDDAAADQAAFLKAQMVFWLLGATDGHAKNFSVALRPGGGFRLTPLYDVLSVQPALDAAELLPKRAKLAMSVGKSRHYVLGTVRVEHFEQTAALGHVDARVVSRLAAELRESVPGALERVEDALPKGFPKALARSILSGVRRRAKLLTPGA